MLTIHRAERADALIGPLARLFSSPLQDPFQTEVIAVPSKGVERWLMQQLSLHLGATGAWDGVAANITFPSPSELAGEVISSVTGWARDGDPWAGAKLVWAVLAVMDQVVSDPSFSMVAHHLGLDDSGDSHRRGRRFATALKLAQLFSAYGEARPAMLTDWGSCRDTDGFGSALPDDMAWQAFFWRRLRDHVGVPSPAERLPEVCALLRSRPAVIDLPARLSVFGPTRLNRMQLEVIDALAADREVHLWLSHPSPAMWETLRTVDAVIRRSDDQTALQVANPLLANLSRDIREMQQLLNRAAIDEHYNLLNFPGGLLGRIQDDIRHSRNPAKSDSRVAMDGSVSIHACHGPVRQVEVLRESLLHLFNSDPSLEPRDVIVLCPDIDSFAPLIASAFGPTDAPHPGHRLRFRIADRGPTKTNPLLQILVSLLDLADARVTVSEVFDLLALGPVMRRFRLSESDLETIRHWTEEAGARWGIGQTQREFFGLPGIRQNTFSTARDRLLVGVAADGAELAWLGTALPLDDVDSSDIDLAGRFAEFLDRLEVVLLRLRGPHPGHEWSVQLGDALELLTEVGDSDLWQSRQADRFLGEFAASARDADLTLADIRAVIADEFRARPTRSNFRTGEITVATLVPMRFVPHRVVAVVGLDDESFPRVGHIDGDDILSLAPCLGERDPRSEDRQLLLDALMSARDNLLLFYTGADPVTGARRPPPAPLADLIDTVTATVESGAEVVTCQPLQPFDVVNFAAPDPFSFDRQAYAAALSARRGVMPEPPVATTALAPFPEASVKLSDLVDFMTDPTQGFLQQRLGVSLPWDAEEASDALPLNVSGLPAWQIGERLLRDVLAGATMDGARQAELRRGTLPPGRFGISQLDNITAIVSSIGGAIVDEVGDLQRGSVEIELELGRYRLTGSVREVYGSTLLAASYSTLAPKHRMAGWVKLLALGAQGHDAKAVIIGRHNRRGKKALLSMPSDPAAVLTALLDVRAAGLCGPLPLGPETSCAYADRRRSSSSSDAREIAAAAWTSTFQRRGENNEKSIKFLYGPDAPFSVWWEQQAPNSEQWCADEPLNRFAQLAVRVFDPLLDHEQSRLLR